jgi:glutathione S-transferase
MATDGIATNGSSTPEIILYTDHGCPWAHRAHIVIKELGLLYKEEIIDRDRPRDPWYLKVNPVR